MTTQPEALLGTELVQQLQGLGYERVRIEDEAGTLSNLKTQLERKDSLTNTSYRGPQNQRSYYRSIHPKYGRIMLMINYLDSGIITGAIADFDYL